MVEPERLEAEDLLGGDLVEVAARARPEGGDDLLGLHGHKLLLLQELREDATAQQLVLRGGVQVGAKLRKGGHLAVLRQLELQRAGDLFHGLDLRGAAHAAHRKADVHCGPDALVEKLCLQEDLPVRDADDVGGDVGADITRLRLDHGQRRERATAVRHLIHLCSALQEPGVQVEDVAWVGLTAGRPAQQQRHLPVRNCLLGEVVVEDHGVLAGVAEVLGHGAARVGGQELQRGRVGRRGRDDRGVLQAVVLPEDLEELRDG
mmetsp:Transcript_23314/g.69765  ORF Transcript_23314/g.69765 Transcript_23314/m.69765 type:complete len:262 (+) Transcript_23314:239-1024(+)